MAVTTPELLLRSADAGWCYERWLQLPDDGNRYEVIDGVHYMSTAPSPFHQWIAKRLMQLVGTLLEEQRVAYPYHAPIGVFMPGCYPVQPDFLWYGLSAPRSSETMAFAGFQTCWSRSNRLRTLHTTPRSSGARTPVRGCLNTGSYAQPCATYSSVPCRIRTSVTSLRLPSSLPIRN